MADRLQTTAAKRCWPWQHVWSKWELWKSNYFQKRTCLRCGKVQSKVV